MRHVHAYSKVIWSAYDTIYLKPAIIGDSLSSQLGGEQEEDFHRVASYFYDMLNQRLVQDHVLGNSLYLVP